MKKLRTASVGIGYWQTSPLSILMEQLTTATQAMMQFLQEAVPRGMIFMMQRLLV
jgi:hypothetical protein